MSYAPNVFITETRVPERFIGKSIIELQIRSVYHVNVIALKNPANENDQKAL
jgi:K+/H+ antiporter YhaU regulatory subunit KhtT